MFIKIILHRQKMIIITLKGLKKYENNSIICLPKIYSYNM